MEQTEFLTALEAVKTELMRYALYLTGDEESASELLQDTIVHAYMGRYSFTTGTRFLNWMARIMRNIHLNSIARKRSAMSYIDYMATVEQIENRTPEELLFVHDIQNCISCLPIEQRIPIKLRMKGLSYEDIAESLEIPLSTIKNRLFAARREIKKMVGR